MAAVFRSNSNITISAAFPVHSAKKCICIHIPRQSRKFINSRQNNSRTLGVYFLIVKINRDWYPVVFVSVKLTSPIGAENLDRLLNGVNVKVLFLERLSAEQAG